jgi:peptidoglycan/xylan/chitin deacetylase (PgdA/CDA1 family)
MSHHFPDNVVAMLAKLGLLAAATASVLTLSTTALADDTTPSSTDTSIDAALEDTPSETPITESTEPATTPPFGPAETPGETPRRGTQVQLEPPPPPPMTPSAIYGRFCTSGAPIRSVSTTDKVVAFTFDDGPWPNNTQAVMSTFERYGWRANFFMIGANVIRYPDIARSVVRRGHGIAAHSVTHRYGISTIASEVSTSANIIQSTTGVRPTFFRAPGLTQSSSIDRAVYNAGMCNISTASDLGDWKSPRASSYTLCSRFNNALRPGAIILLHDGGSHSQTVNAVSCMLESVRRNGYRVVDLGALLSRRY